MHLTVYIQLIFLCVVNIIFTFSGIVLNTLVITSFWKSSQLRKKLCHFMILVLSCFDLVSVVTNNPGILLYLIYWLREDYHLLQNITIYLQSASVSVAFSLFSLLVMSIERYLGVYYPIFHRTSVTRRRLLTLLAILLILSGILGTISTNDLVIYRERLLIIFIVVFLPPFLFVNFKLLIIAAKEHRKRTVSPGLKRAAASFKYISMGLWVVACVMLLSIPSGFLIAFNLAEKPTNTVRLSYIWALTSATMNCTFNSLIFFWKNKVLRTEGIKILEMLKIHIEGS